MSDSRRFDDHHGRIADLSHDEAMRLLRGTPQALLDSMVETPLMIRVSSHVTGTQVTFTLAADGMAPLVVWLGSWWVADCYHSSDRDVLGSQPGCDFARPLVAAFFTRLQAQRRDEQEAHAVAMADQALARAVRQNAHRDAWAKRVRHSA